MTKKKTYNLKKFDNYDEKRAYEKNKLHVNSLKPDYSNCHNLLDYWRTWKEYKKTKEDYLTYEGGWWINDQGFACSDSIYNIQTKYLFSNTLCLEVSGEDLIKKMYVYYKYKNHFIEVPIEQWSETKEKFTPITVDIFK